MRSSFISFIALVSISLVAGCDAGPEGPLDDGRGQTADEDRGSPAVGKADQILSHCDDGTAPVCTIAEPKCGPDEVLAAINGCVACVDAETCELTDPSWPAPSCEGACGDKSPGGCWCDDECADWGDCCLDYEEVCIDGDDDDDGSCDDDSVPVCFIAEPDCPEGTISAVHDGCFTCADEETCEPLGLPLNCDDGSDPVCLIAEPTCEADEVLAVQNGCFACVDPFTCE